MNKSITTIVAITALLGICASNVSHAQHGARLPVLDLTAGMHVIKAEVAATEPQRQQGLMYREKMGTNEGMLFVYDVPVGLCMWMKNTLIPLSVAFIDANGTIVNVEEMKPQTTSSHCGKKQVPFALEMNQGWFSQRGIGPGSVIQGLPKGR